MSVCGNAISLIDDQFVAVKWRKPRNRVKHYILRLSEDTSLEFGSRVHYFIESTLMKRGDAHQKLLSDVRTV